MSKTQTPKELLVVALQDLHDAEVAWNERGAALSDVAGTQLSAFLKTDLKRSVAQRMGLETLLGSLKAEVEGDPNIWLRAILDDAERDSRSIIAGPLRDTALIGAFRKGKQAERVSYETAVLLARRLGMKDVDVRLTAFRGQEEQADRELESLLQATIGILTVQPE